ncbi:hypothetical protein [Geminocystis herdmanii]|uniref:hypothetical protein n=1 Tax=Geminocystis herdmanii TaxID=669359 RepID=UPI000348CA01|nr:hypothetical protein [Geminocystis herdmanii]
MNLIASPEISFEEAIDLTAQFINTIPELSDSEKSSIVSALVLTENGARGFFVTYLTSENEVIDRTDLSIIEGLKKSPEIVSELLVKNVAMSTAMGITHTRNNNLEMAQKSARVTQRSLNFIQQLSLAEISIKIQQLISSIECKEGLYQQFLTKWGYDEEQKQAIIDIFNK